jgi:hypothetical protein
LVSLAQKIGLAPEGYIRVYPSTGLPNAQLNIGDLLKRRRKLRQLTVGPGSDISLSSPAQPEASWDDDDVDFAPRKKQRPDWRERLFGKPALAVIGRHFRGNTFLQKKAGGPKVFKEDVKSETFADADEVVEFSLKELS